MNKEDVLEQYRNEKVDEGVEHVNRISNEYGFFSMMILTIVITVYKSYKNIPYGDIASLPLVYLAFESFRRYRDTKERDTLVYGIITSLLCFAFLSWYVIKTS